MSLITMPRVRMQHVGCEGCARCASACFDAWPERRTDFVTFSQDGHAAILARA